MRHPDDSRDDDSADVMNDDDDPLNFETNGTDPPIATDLTQRNDLRRRAMLVFSLLGLGALLLSARLIHVQWICRDQFASRAMRQQISDEEINFAQQFSLH